LVGAYSPPFKPLLEMDHEDILRRVREANPDLLLVAFGCPKQEKWINMHYRGSGVPVSVGVGATIDFLAGTFRRAPVWMQKTGLEWIYRMLQEPGRLVKRYGKDFWIFGRAIIPQLVRLRPHSVPHAPVVPPRQETDATGTVMLRMPVRLDAPAAEGLQPLVEEVARRGSVVVNLEDTEFADSTGFGLLIRLAKRARACGHEVVLAAPRPAVVASLKLMRLDMLMAWAPSLDQARALVTRRQGAAGVLAGIQAGALRILWRGDATAATAAVLESESLVHLEGLRPGIGVAIDLGEVGFVDSTGVGLMLRLKKRARQQGFDLVYDRANPSVVNVVRMTRLEEYLLGRKA
jgi:N-acetylglucosaminyldiphosphoundecaprenol N-acetyl-beta-D-mannosaminyltransferase